MEIAVLTYQKKNKKTSHLKSPTASLSAPSGPPVTWWSEMISHNDSAGDRPRALMWRWRLNYHTSEHATGIYWNLAHCDVWNVVRGDHEYCVFVQYFKTIIRFGRKCSCEVGTENLGLLSSEVCLTWFHPCWDMCLWRMRPYTRALRVVSLNMEVTLPHDGAFDKWCVLERLESLFDSGASIYLPTRVTCPMCLRENLILKLVQTLRVR